MNFSYFPGCTLKTKAKDLDFYARKCGEVLGFSLSEIPDWQCCGGVFITAEDEIASKLASVRALKAAFDRGEPLVSVCSACHNTIKQTNYLIRSNDDFRQKVNIYMKGEQEDFYYGGECEVLNYLEVLRDKVGFENVAKRVVKPLKDRRIAPFYGCLLLRPSAVLGMDDPENPSIMEDFVSALGASPVYFPMRNECCGGYILIENRDLATERSRKIIESAKKAGADCIVTSCPLCKYNLENCGSDLPVFYITEILAEALGV